MTGIVFVVVVAICAVAAVGVQAILGFDAVRFDDVDPWSRW